MAIETEIARDDRTLVEGIGQIALTVNDLAESKRFYGELLGMRFLFDAGAMAFYECGGIRLMLGLAEKPTKPEGTILYFRVAGIEAACAALRSRGAEFLQEPHPVAKMPDHDLWMAFVKDPSGNVLGLMSEIRPGA
jgi:methylmalonyl-CoA/ethylmalonyl-CoA epimerase